MKIFVKTKVNAKEETVKRIDETHFIVAVKEPPIKGKANKAILKALANFFHLSQSQMQIVSGFTSREKIVRIT